MKNVLCLFLVAYSWATSNSESCNLDRVIQDVAVSVVSEAAGLLVSNAKKSLERSGKSEKTVQDCKITSQPTSSDGRTCLPKDCADVGREGHTRSGVYRIWPEGWSSCGLQVYCDLENVNGGWTVIQRRGDFGKPKDYFYRRWRDYKFGFGNLTEDFWLGNDKIYFITNQDNYELRVDLKTKEGESRYANYDEFFIESEDNKYRLWIDGYTGDAGDSLKPQNGHVFTTKDKDNDNFDKNCAVEFKGAWWYNKCHESNLNGQYHNGEHTTFADGINWKTWKGYHNSYSDAVMKIRPKTYR